MYSSIYARSRSEWNMDKQQLYQFTEEKLNLKKPITSLKDLSDIRLKKLYTILVVHYQTRFIFRLFIFLSKINLFKN